jgi:hypothetical protein
MKVATTVMKQPSPIPHLRPRKSACTRGISNCTTISNIWKFQPTVGPPINQPATIAPIEYVVLTKPSNSPACGVHQSIFLLNFIKTYRTIEPMQPLFVLLHSVENGSIITIQHHASCCHHRRIPCFKSEFHVLKSRGYRAYQLYNLVLSTILTASESSLERREVSERVAL